MLQKWVRPIKNGVNALVARAFRLFSRINYKIIDTRGKHLPPRAPGGYDKINNISKTVIKPNNPFRAHPRV